MESSTTREAAQSLRRDVKTSDVQINSIYTVVEQKKTIAARDANLAADALRESNKAQGNADEAAKKVIQAKVELDEILRIIATVEEPGTHYIRITIWYHIYNTEPGLLDDLERRLDAAEKQYEEAGIEARLTELYAERTRQVRVQKREKQFPKFNWL